MLRRTFIACVVGLGLALAEAYAPHRPWAVPLPCQPRVCVWIGEGVLGDWMDPRNWVDGRIASMGDTAIFGGPCEAIVPQEVERLERVVVLDDARVRIGQTTDVRLDCVEANAWQMAGSMTWDD